MNPVSPVVRGFGALALVLALGAAPPPDAPVADAAMRGDVDGVRALLRSGADVNAAQGDGMTALHWAAESGSEELAELLTYAGAHLESVTRIGSFTPLHVAGRSGSGPVVRILVARGADVRARTTTGETALHFAAASGSVPAVAALVEAGADVEARERSAGQTPLMFAAASGRDGTVSFLLEAGADPSAETRVVDYPAVAEQDRKASEERLERLEYLHGESRADYSLVDGTNQDDEEEAEDESSESAEVEGAVGAATEEARSTGASGPGGVEEPARRKPLRYDELVGKQGGHTALLYAVREGHVEAVRALLAAGADVDQVSAGDGTSPLLMATLNGHFDLALELLRMGADPNLRSDPGATPLYAAVHMQWVPKSFYPQPRVQRRERTTYLELMEALLEAGADPDARLERHLWYTSFNHNVLGVDTWGATPFWRAAYGTDVEAMKLLVAYGADPTLPTFRPPGRESTGNGADDTPAVEDPSGLPPVPVGGPGVLPIHAASGVGYGLGLAGNAHRHAPDGWLPSVTYLVEELGADVNARDYNGFTPLHNAAARGDVDLILYLVEQGADVTVLTRKGQTTADMANGPVQRVTVFPEVVALLERLGSKNNHNCVSC
jgi:ankyrin repeat protein